MNISAVDFGRLHVESPSKLPCTSARDTLRRLNLGYVRTLEQESRAEDCSGRGVLWRGFSRILSTKRDFLK